jgi:pilus assembly protein CpaD
MTMQIGRTTIAKRRGIAGLVMRAAMAGGCAMFVAACNTDQQVAGVPDAPYDYRQRHPITMTEANHTLEIFVGTSRGELNATQRAEVAQFAHAWRREATGGVRMIRSILAAANVPPDGIAVRSYPAPGPNIAPIRVSYPKIAGQAGPCGLWPQDIGPSYNRDHFENQPAWNHGCATQRNLAAMVDNPADLVQPRGETPAYTTRRTTVLEKYRSGNSPATQYPTLEGKISDIAR